MADDVSQRLDLIVEHLKGLEKVLTSIDSKLGSHGAPAVVPAPPPVLPAEPSYRIEPTPPPRPHPPYGEIGERVYVPSVKFEPPTPSMPVGSPAQAKKSGGDTEYVIGAKLIPWVGSLLVVLGIIYLVGWGFSNGYITKQMMFAGECLLSLAFVGAGQRYRKAPTLAGDQFGQLLTGVGLAGLYLVVVGGYLVYHLYGGDTLVALTMLVSFGSLGLSWLRSWPSLWILGMIGGLYSATLPLSEGQLALGATLHLIVVAAGATLTVRMGKPVYPVVLLLGALAALAPAASVNYEYAALLTAALGSGLMCMAAFNRVVPETLNDPWSFSAFVVPALGLLAIRHHQPWYLLTFCAATMAIGPLNRRLLNAQIGLGVMVASLYAPWCYDWEPRTYALTALGSGFAILSLLRFRRSALAGATLLLIDASMSMFLGQATTPNNPGLLGALLFTTIACTAAAVSYFYRDEGVRVPFGVGLLVVVWAYSSLLVSQLVDRAPADKFALSATWGLLAAIILGVGFLFKLQEFRYSSFVLFGITVWKVLVYDLSDMEVGFRVAILLALGILMLIAGYGYVRQKRELKPHGP